MQMEGVCLADEVGSASFIPQFQNRGAHRAHINEGKCVWIDGLGNLMLSLCVPDHTGNSVCPLMPPLVEARLDRWVLSENLLLEQHGCGFRRSLEDANWSVISLS